MRDKPTPVTILHGLFAVLCTIAIALALGAAWMAVALRTPSAHWWFALPVGAAMGYAARAWVTQHRRWAVALAVPGTLLAMIYMSCLLVGLQLAAVMGLDYLDTLQRAGIGMLLALARASLQPRLVGATLVGMVLAGWMAWHKPRSREDAAIK